MKSDIEIKDDVYAVLKDSDLMAELKGVLTKTVRPLNSTKEDAVISVLANSNGQIQTAFVNVNIYVADKLRKQGSQQWYEEDSVRLRTIGNLAKELFESVVAEDFMLKLDEQRVMAAGNGTEHVINNKLRYKTINN